MELKRKLKETLVYFLPKGKPQWASFIIVIVLLVSSLAYVLASLPNIPDDVKYQMNTESFYTTGIVIQTSGEVCDGAVESHPRSVEDVPSSWHCLQTYVKIPGYGNHELQTPYGMTLNDLQPGTKVVVVNYDNGTTNDWSFVSVDRSYLMIFALSFCALMIILVTGAKGIRAIVGIGLSLAAIILYLVPSMLSGHPLIPTTLSISILILGLIMYLTHGIKWMTTIAFLGTTGGIGVIVLLGWLFDLVAKSKTSLPIEMLELMRFLPQGEVDVLNTLSYIYFASLILASIGVLNDVMIAQSSTVWQIRLSDKEISVRELFFKGMSVGKDHVSSAMYTLVFVYASTALPIIISAYLYTNMSFLSLLSSDFGIEILKTGVCIIGLMISVPLTTWFASFMSSHVGYKSLKKGADSHQH